MTIREIGATLTLAAILAGVALVVVIFVGLLFVRDRSPRPPRGPGRGEDDIPPNVNPYTSERVSFDAQAPLPMTNNVGPVESDAVSRYDHQAYLRALGEAQRRRDHDPIEVEVPKDLPIRIDVHEWPWTVEVEHDRD